MRRRHSPPAASPLDYRPLLRQWSRELRARDLAAQLGVATASPDWLGGAPASAADLAAAEARLGIALPPSYRQFLLTSDGWGTLSPFVQRLRSSTQIDWFVTENANAVEVWGASDDGRLDDDKYFDYSEANPDFRGEHLRHALQISEGGDGDVLLNPRAVTPDGEWECWFLAAWIPGANRYPSFAHWLLHEYRSFRRLEGASGSEPLLPELPSPAPQAKRRALKPKRAKPPRRSSEELIAAMASKDDPIRAKAVKEFAGQLQSRAHSERRPDLLEPLTQLFRSSADRDVRSLCVQMITQVAPDGPTPHAIIEAFSDSDPWVVQAAMWAEYYFSIDLAFDALCRFVDTTDNPLVKDSAVGTLGRLANPKAIPVLLRVLRDPSQDLDQLFGSAGLALSAFGPAALPHLVEAINDPDSRIRLAGVIGLGQLSGPIVLNHLRSMLNDPDETVRTRAEMMACRCERRV